MVFRESFVKNGGLQLFYNERSILAQVMSIGEKLSEEEKASYSKIILNYLESVKEVSEGTDTVLPELVRMSDFAKIKNGKFYKFVSRENAERMRNGLFNFGSLEAYRETEDKGRRDVQEGYSAIFFEGTKKSFNFAGVTGFNSYILCGSKEIPDDPSILSKMHDEGRDSIVEITNIRAFTSAIAESIGAVRYHVGDVIYQDGKYITLKSQTFDKVANTLRTADLSDEAVHEFNENYWKLLQRNLLFPSIFVKPKKHSYENERRIVFELSSDVKNKYLRPDKPILEAAKFISIFK